MEQIRIILWFSFLVGSAVQWTAGKSTIRSVTSNSKPTRNAITLCYEKPNGNYSLTDVFKYVRCFEQKGEIANCQYGYVFESTIQSCISQKFASIQSFCINKSNGNFRNPWDCHTYIACVHGRSFVMPCQKSLIYDPEYDFCVHPRQSQCVQFKIGPTNLFPPVCNDSYCNGEQHKMVSLNPFKYLICDEQRKCHLHSCNDDEIFFPETLTCMDPSKAGTYFRDYTSFCKNRENLRADESIPGWYTDPWDCKQGITCPGGITITAIYCQLYHFNPISQSCDSGYNCTEIKNKTGTIPS